LTVNGTSFETVSTPLVFLSTFGSPSPLHSSWASSILFSVPSSVAATKRVASRALELSRSAAADAIAKEFAALVASHDHAEALAAFREKREPQFKGN